MFDLEQYNYRLPQKLLAIKPASPRDNSKLLVYNTTTNTIKFDRFVNLDKYLPSDSFLVFNNTKVLPARLTLTKDTGGQVVVLLLLNELKSGQALIKGMVDRKVTIGQKLYITKRLWLTATKQLANIFTFKPNFKTDELFSLAQKYGHTPIPPYLKASKLKEIELRKKYQSIFAKQPASIAAPTASLHFTKRVLGRLNAKKIPQAFVTLHVGMGTFAPIDEKNFKSHKLFNETYQLTVQQAATINRLKKNRHLIAVGTTAVRALESAARHSKSGTLKPRINSTDLFIMPGYKFKKVDGMITNFHLPKSSLMLLVQALLEDKQAKKSLTELYQLAIKKNFRFYSFGDSMLIL